MPVYEVTITELGSFQATITIEAGSTEEAETAVVEGYSELDLAWGNTDFDVELQIELVSDCGGEYRIRNGKLVEVDQEENDGRRAEMSSSDDEQEALDKFPKLIECGDHSFAPWGLTCVHISEGTATDVVPIPRPPEINSEVEFDWLCPECARKHFGFGADSGDDLDLKVVCIHCLRRLLSTYLAG